MQKISISNKDPGWKWNTFIFLKMGFKVALILIIEIVLYENIKYFWWLCLVVVITQLLLHSDPEPRLLGISS